MTSDMLDLLRSLEWCYPQQGAAGRWFDRCPRCRGLKPTHAPDCRLDQAIRGLSATDPRVALADAVFGPELPPDDVQVPEDVEPSVDEMAREMGLVIVTDGVRAHWADRETGAARIYWSAEKARATHLEDTREWLNESDAIRTLYREHKARRAIPVGEIEKSADDMAAEMGLVWIKGMESYIRPFSADRDYVYHDDIGRVYGEWRAKQLADTVAGKRLGPWLTPPAPKVYEASKLTDHAPLFMSAAMEQDMAWNSPSLVRRPTDPSALAAWLYARVVPGRTVVEISTGASLPSKFVIARVGHDVFGHIFVEDTSRERYLLGGMLRLLNPDGTVLWEAK